MWGFDIGQSFNVDSIKLEVVYIWHGGYLNRFSRV